MDPASHFFPGSRRSNSPNFGNRMGLHTGIVWAVWRHKSLLQNHSKTTNGDSLENRASPNRVDCGSIVGIGDAAGQGSL